MGIILFLFVFLYSFLFADINTEDLGSVEKTIKSDSKVVEKSENQLELIDSDKVFKDTNDSKKVFFKSLGSITIRAKEDYVFIRAGDSAIIMDSSGKIIIDSAKNLIIQSKQNIVFKAKKDIIFSTEGQIIAPKLKIEESKKEKVDGEKKSN